MSDTTENVARRRSNPATSVMPQGGTMITAYKWMSTFEVAFSHLVMNPEATRLGHISAIRKIAGTSLREAKVAFEAASLVNKERLEALGWEDQIWAGCVLQRAEERGLADDEEEEVDNPKLDDLMNEATPWDD